MTRGIRLVALSLSALALSLGTTACGQSSALERSNVFPCTLLTANQVIAVIGPLDTPGTPFRTGIGCGWGGVDVGGYPNGVALDFYSSAEFDSVKATDEGGDASNFQAVAGLGVDAFLSAPNTADLLYVETSKGVLRFEVETYASPSITATNEETVAREALASLAPWPAPTPT